MAMWGTSPTVAISIHALRVESDLKVAHLSDLIRQFQSTPSVWRATTAVFYDRSGGMYFNPRPPCGERLVNAYGQENINANISIHALRVESDGS